MSKATNREKKSFVVYADWESYIEALDTDEERGKLFSALFAFAKRGEEPQFTGALKMAFLVMRDAIERDSEKWELTRQARSEAGKKGGAPKGNRNASKTETNITNNCFSEQTNQAVNVNVNDNVNDNDNVNVSGNGNEPIDPTPTPLTQYNKFPSYPLIKMNDEEYNDLVLDYGLNTIDDYLNRLNSYLINHPEKHYISHSATIRSWISQDGIQKQKEDSFNVDKYKAFVNTFDKPLSPNIDPLSGGYTDF